MQYIHERIGAVLKELAGAIYRNRKALSSWQIKKVNDETKLQEAGDTGWQELAPDLFWTGDREYYVFRNTIEIPAEMDGQTVEVELRTGREGEWDAENPQFTAFVNGRLICGLDVNHRMIRLTQAAHAGERYELFLSAFTGTRKSRMPILFDTSICTVDKEVMDFYYDLLIPWQIAQLLDPKEELYVQYLSELNAVINRIDLRKIGSEAFSASIREAGRQLGQFYEKYSDEEQLPVICCIGHTHIDVAWLWTLSVTRDKAVRSFATVLELMRRYPEYLFMSSQPQLYQYVKEQQPQLYEQIRERVKEGRWETEGGMYVEADCNLSSGESLIRQFIYGKRFFMDEFGRDNEILWLPDAFGYSAALPQIMEKCGIRYFMTTKISWNDTDLLPYDTFYWKGIDGTKILTHLITTRDYVINGRMNVTSKERNVSFTTTYNGYINPSQMKGAWQRYQQKGLSSEVLCSFGFGDGGGGPTVEMLETERRLRRGLPGCTRTRQDTAGHFFHRLEKETENKEVPVWNGELYLEYHRGTYTSMARNKRYNRKAEFALQTLETLGVISAFLARDPYPQELLEEEWKVLLVNQFHDILPGSSIEEVYTESQQQYLRLFERIGERTAGKMQLLADMAGQDLVFNMTGRRMSGYVLLPAENGFPHAQKTYDGRLLAWAENVPAKGYKAMDLKAPAVCGEITRDGNCIVTPFAKVTFSETGQILSWYDRKEEREILQQGMMANRLTAYEDIPFEFDNWNIENYYKEKGWPVDDLVSFEVVEEGPYRYTIRFIWRYQESQITEYVSLYANTARIDFTLDIDWHEQHTLLKALFPVELNTTKASYEIQYGNVERPTTRNTSWEQAKFEVCFHKWMDLSEGDYGVSFLNDCKYGVGVDDNVVGLTLIKSGTYPNPNADQGKHHMVFSVLPHRGTWLSAGTVDQAYLLNDPLVFCAASGKRSGQRIPDQFEAAVCDADNVMVEIVKQADRSDDLIIRLYEYGNRRTKTKLHLGFRAARIFEADMLENRKQLIAEDTDVCELEIRPFEIYTIAAEL